MIPFGMFAPKGAPVVPGSITYSTPGSFSFEVPAHNTLTMHVYGAGASGVSAKVGAAAGGYSAWDDGGASQVRSNGGEASAAGVSSNGGTASGGTTNTTGENGATGYGGSCYGPQGGARQTGSSQDGNSFGGGGRASAGGGGGGYATRVLSGLTEEASIPIRVGAGGSGNGVKGANGAVVISWS